MCHELVEAVVLGAVEVQASIVLFDELQCLPHLVLGKSCCLVRQVQFAHHAPCYGVAVKDGVAGLQGQAFKGVSYGVPEVQCLAQALLVGVLADDVFLHFHRAAYEAAQKGVVRLVGVKRQKVGPMPCVAYQAVLQHFGVAGIEVVGVEGVQKAGVDDHATGRGEHAYLVLQSVEVDARFPAYRGIDHCQQCGGHVDVGNAAFEGRGSHASQVGHHASADVDQEGVPAGSFVAQFLPYVAQTVEGLVFVSRSYIYRYASLQLLCLQCFGQAQLGGGVVGQDE